MLVQSLLGAIPDLGHDENRELPYTCGLSSDVKKMKWKHRYMWYCLIFAIVLSFILLGFGVYFPFNMIGYIPWVIAIIYAITYDWRLVRKRK